MIGIQLTASRITHHRAIVQKVDFRPVVGC